MRCILCQNSFSFHCSLPWITVLSWQRGLCNSVKLWAVTCRANQDGRNIVKSSNKMWSTGEGNSNPLQTSCLENPMDNMRMQKDYWGFIVNIKTRWCESLNFILFNIICVFLPLLFHMNFRITLTKSIRILQAKYIKVL